MWTQIILGFFTLLKGIAWPLATVAIAVGYKPEILPNVGAFLRRKLRISVSGIGELEAGAAEEQQKAVDISKTVSDPSAVELEELEGLPRTKAIEALERRIHVMLPNVKGNHVNVLVRNLAQSRLESDFGITYARIFGTQISAVIQLEAIRKVNNNAALQFYQLNVEKHNAEFYKDYGYAGWLGFLIERALVYHVNNNEIEISDVGIDFVKWLKAHKLPTNKPW